MIHPQLIWIWFLLPEHHSLLNAAIARPSPTTHTTSNQISQLEQAFSLSNQPQMGESILPSLHLDAESPQTYKGSQEASRITLFSAFLPLLFHSTSTLPHS